MRLSKSTSSLSPCRPRVKGVRAISSSRSFPEASRTIRRGGLVGICFDSAVGDGRRRSIPLAAAEQNLDQSITRANARAASVVAALYERRPAVTDRRYSGKLHELTLLGYSSLPLECSSTAGPRRGPGHQAKAVSAGPSNPLQFVRDSRMIGG